MDIRQRRKAFRRLVVEHCQNAFGASLHELVRRFKTENTALQLVRSAGYHGIAELPRQGMRRLAWLLRDNADIITRQHGYTLHAIWDILEGARPSGGGPLLLAQHAVPASDGALDLQLSMLYGTVCGRDILAFNGHLDARPNDGGGLELHGRLSGDLLARALVESMQPIWGVTSVEGLGALYLGLLHARNLRRPLQLLSMQLNQQKTDAGRKRLHDKSDSGFTVTIPMPQDRD